MQTKAADLMLTIKTLAQNQRIMTQPANAENGEGVQEVPEDEFTDILKAAMLGSPGNEVHGTPPRAPITREVAGVRPLRLDDQTEATTETTAEAREGEVNQNAIGNEGTNTEQNGNGTGRDGNFYRLLVLKRKREQIEEITDTLVANIFIIAKRLDIKPDELLLGVVEKSGSMN